MKIPAFSKTYNGRTVLDLPELELPEDRITAVIGPNGSGKSTFARVLSGIERPDGRRPVLPDTSVGYLPQKSYAFRMSTEKNVLLGGPGRERALVLMKELGIESLSRQSAKKLSGGETARMALCRLLMKRFQLLILDEPTSAMDMESTLAAERLIRACGAGQGCAVLIITHSLQQARRVSDRTLFLYQGKLIEQGDTDRLLRQPREEQTRQFLDFYGMRQDGEPC
ncbi:MAG: ATP-binding cassette domain-containing protein [Oscillospiraceae bacterium]|nr:ATP-binding cassette domain-containing protein [Oscillospiraceae bacterium]